MAEFEVPFGDGRKKRGKRAPVVVGLLVVAVLVVGAAVWALGGGQSFEIVTGQDLRQAVAAEGEVEGEGGVAEGQPEETVFVHVTGAVVSPGVYEVAEGSRVTQAIEAAGGFAEGAATGALNLARVVADGEQIVVPTQEELQAAQASGSSGDASAAAGSGMLGGKVNINTATAEQLDALPGVGASTAAKIVADREANGPFSTCEDLKRVSGIGDKKYEALADQICVG